MNKTNSFKLGATLLAGAAISMSANGAGSFDDVHFSGFVSQGYVVNSGVNNYIGDSSEGNFDFREYAANASYASGKWRFGGQLFGQKLGEYGDDKISLDWAVVDYQASRQFGVRAGRVKMPRGLYNEALDVDAIRPFVLMPQSVYDARLRDFNAAFNGAMVYGGTDVGNFGSLDYKVFYGDMPVDTNSGASHYFNTGFKTPTLSMKMDSIIGASLFWETPVDGLRFGVSFNELSELKSIRERPATYGTGNYTKTADAYKRELASVEYTLGDWVFALEGGREKTEFVIDGLLVPGESFSYEAEVLQGYVSATRRMNERLELGAYFSYSQDQQATFALLRGADTALSARFDLTPNWLVKVEGHYINGAGKIFDTATYVQPLASRDRVWHLFAVKTTYSF